MILQKGNMEMKKLLVVVDMQKDFVDGSLGTKEAVGIVPNVKKKIEEYLDNDDRIVFTQDTHYEDYLDTQEGKILSVKHCIYNTDGWEIIEELKSYVHTPFYKNTFGSVNFAERINRDFMDGVYDSVELIGLCTDICVISNALLIKAFSPELKITVDASCCAGVTPESHKAALLTMKMCQINVIGE